MTSLSIVEYFGQNRKGSCGYCKGKASSLSHGMWGHVLTPQDYQDLIDRGWRRSGKYVYKPTMHETCCPQYTIRCHPQNFKPTKSHRKSLKKFRNYLLNDAGGRRKKSHVIPDLPPKRRDPLYSSDDDDTNEGSSNEDVDEDFEAENADQAEKKTKYEKNTEQTSSPWHQASKVASSNAGATGSAELEAASSPRPNQSSVSQEKQQPLVKSRRPPRPGLGPDPNKPKPRKAKDIKRERALMKANKGLDKSLSVSQTVDKSKRDGCGLSLEELTGFSLSNSEGQSASKHKFEIRMVRATFEDPEFIKTADESFEVYRKYQVMIHKDKPKDCSMSQFKRFLCSSPILEGEPVKPAESRSFPPNYFPYSYGGYHQQYLVDGKIVCVGVLDILPNCVSSVYLYYDPDYSFLSLGTVSALLEIAYVKNLRSHWSPRMTYYYMGFYIHSCPKMRYKAQYDPSQLLCPETFDWVNVQDCILLLDKSKYARLNLASPDKVNQLKVKPSKDRLARVALLYQRRPTHYITYNPALATASTYSEEDLEVAEYYNLVGEKVSYSMLLFRSSC